MAHLVVCCDGTWNTPDDMDGGVPAPTNVVKIHHALADRTDTGIEQKKYYHPGVGTDGGWWNKVVGGGAGEGLDRNIESAYHWLARNYRPNDKIFLFGFSRGAYTVRSLGGMIARCGLLDLSDPALDPDAVWDRVDQAFDCYRKRGVSAALTALTFHNRPDGTGDPKGTTPIHFIGVWDTVGALGIPDDMAILNLLDDPKKQRFHDTDLSASVAHARHAVAMDELRQSFAPTFWTNVEARPTVKQIWFPGVHSDVGGGYGQTGLSDGALQWMMDEAEALGLRYRPQAKAQIKPDYLGMLHDSVTSVFKVLKTNPRCVPNLADTSLADNFHVSAHNRFADPPIQQATYWPTATLAPGESKAVDVFAREKWNATHLFLTEGRYQLSASGQWLDASIKCGPEGASDGRFEIGELAHMASSALGQIEKFWKNVSGNVHADFGWTKRVEEYDWFALIGVIANGLGAGNDGSPLPHTDFQIGAGCALDIGPGKAGYLYCFANDAWHAYDNNKGSVRLTVTRIA